MTALHTVADILRRQATTRGSIVMNSDVLPQETVTEINTAFALPAGNDLTIEGVTAKDIPDPVGNVLTISAGTASVLNQTGVPAGLEFTGPDEFTEPAREVEVTITAPMQRGWHFSDSFEDLTFFPFQDLAVSNVYFVYTSIAQQEYPWPGSRPVEPEPVEPEPVEPEPVEPEPVEPEYPSEFSGLLVRSDSGLFAEGDRIDLAAGLNFLSDITFDNIPLVGTILDDLLGPSMKLYGPFTPVRGLSLPIGTLRAEVTPGTFSIGVEPLVLSLSEPSVAASIATGDDAHPVQPIDYVIDFVVEGVFENELDVAISIPATGSPHSTSITPLPAQKSVAALIESLPGGAGFTKYIPEELSDIFSMVGLDKYTMVINSDPKVTYLGLSIGTPSAWTVIPGVLVLKSLSLRIERCAVLESYILSVYINASAAFLPDIFVGEFDFTVHLEEHNGWSVDFISGAYFGSVNLGDIVSGLTRSSYVVPDTLEDIVFSDFGTTLTRSAATEPFTYSLYGGVDAALPLLDFELSAHLIFTAVQADKTYDIQITGSLVVGGQAFDLHLEIGTAKSNLTASWTATGTDYLQVEDVITAFGFTAPDIPDELDLSLSSASFTYNFTTETLVLEATSTNFGQAVFVALKNQTLKKWQFFFGLAIDEKIDLSNLPLVGAEVGPLITIDKLQIIISSQAIEKAMAERINSEIADGYPKVSSAGISKGTGLSTVLEFSGEVFPLEVGIVNDSPPASEPENTVLYEKNALPSSNTMAPSTAMAGSSQKTSADSNTWLTVQKSIGPLNLSRIGFGYQSGKLWFLLDGGLHTKVLSLDLQGLGAGLDISDPTALPGFELMGLDVQVQSGPLSISGALLKGPPSEEIKVQYEGELGIEALSLSISAYGSYAELKSGEASLFAFAVIDYPLGGPPAFFITGGSVGFGYNRDLILPTIDEVSTYPFVEAATDPTSYKNLSLSDVLDKMGQDSPVQVGEYWVSGGLKFTSFELINSFALAAINFGTKLEIALIGLSNVEIPTDASSPVAEAQLALEVRIFPDEGFVGVDAKLTPNSYVLSKACTLTGGFAFYVWFGGNVHAGDFVLTLGGYHPRYKKPGYYPDVPRLGMNWQVSKEMIIKGTLYFALTPVCIMAGGALSAVWQSGAIKAWFDLYADLLIFWKPYHYDIDAGIELGVSLHIQVLFVNTRLTIRLGADLHIWGPEFSGTAEIHLYIVSFTISIGDAGSQDIKPIPWLEFKTSFLGKDDSTICSILVVQGLKKQAAVSGDADYLILDNEDFALETGSLAPSKTSVLPDGVTITGSEDTNRDFGVGLVRVDSDGFSSEHSIEFSRTDGGACHTDSLRFEAITQSVSQSLWKNINSVSELEEQGVRSGSTTIDNVLVGYRITAQLKKPDQTLPVRLSMLLYDTHPVPYQAETKPDVPTTDAFDQKTVLTRIATTIEQSAPRDEVLAILQEENLISDTRVEVTELVDHINSYFIENPILSYLGEEKPVEQRAA